MTTSNAMRHGAHECVECPLAITRTHVVWGDGPQDPKFVIVGEAPGFNEDLTGVPFQGRSGQLLTFLLREAGISREEVYITNMVKCRPPLNRDPNPMEINACAPWYHAELADFTPRARRVFLLLGKYAARLALPHEIGNLQNGTARAWDQVLPDGTTLPSIAVISYHPAYALRDSSGEIRRSILTDIRRAKRYSEQYT